MEKQITYKGKKHTLIIEWAGSSYAANIDKRGFKKISDKALCDPEQLKRELIHIMENKGDLGFIMEWDGNLDAI